MSQLPPLTAQPEQKSVPAYQKPQVSDLGRWQAVTLVYSLPGGPGGKALGQPGQMF